MLILASDYDGTLKQNGTVSKEDIDAIRKFQSAGNKFGIITGRAVMSIRGELEKYNVPIDFLVSGNGAIIVDGNYQILKRFEMKPEDAYELIEELKKDERNVLGISDGYDFGRIQEGRPDTGKVIRSKETEAAKIDYHQILEKNIFSLIFFRQHNNEATLKKVEELKQQFLGRIVFHYNNGAVDATAWPVDKKVGLEELQELFDGKVIPIGDGYNDIPMIEAFNGFGITSGVEEVKQAASKVVDNIHSCIDALMENSTK